MEGLILPIAGIIALIVLWKVLTKLLRFVLTAGILLGIVYVFFTYLT